MIHDDTRWISRRTVLKGIAGFSAGSLLAACGGDTGAGPSGASTNPTVDQPETTPTSVPVSAATTSGATVPERVVTLGYEDELLALGIKPVAAGTTYAGGWYPHLEEQMRDVTRIGRWYEPNLEAILATEPGLIIALDSLIADYDDQLQAIAPTEYVTFTGQGGAAGARENLINVARILGLEDRAGTRFDEHLSKIEEAKAQLAETVDNQSVAFLRVLEKEFRLVTIAPGYIGPVLYEDLGLTPPAYIEQVTADAGADSYGWVPMSLEVVPDIQADHIFFLSENEDTLRELTESSLWQTLPAVKNGNLYQVNDVTWQTTAIQANESKIEDVVAMLAGEASVTDTSKVESRSDFTYPEFTPDPPIFTILSETGDSLVVRDFYGEVTVPRHAQRIVTLEELSTDIVLGVGVKPVGALGDPDGNLSRFFDGRVDGVTILPGWEPNLEAVLALEPDLIVHTFTIEPEIYESLNKIAPTLASYPGAFPFWRQATLDLTAVLGFPEEGERLLAEWEEAKTSALDKLPPGLSDGSESLAVIAALAKEFRLYGIGFERDGKLYSTNVSQVPYFDLRLTPPAMARDIKNLTSSGYLVLSLEVLPEIDADHILLFSLDEEKGAELENHPLWLEMPAVQKGQVYRLPSDSTALGPVNMIERLDEFVQTMNGG